MWRPSDGWLSVAIPRGGKEKLQRDRTELIGVQMKQKESQQPRININVGATQFPQQYGILQESNFLVVGIIFVRCSILVRCFDFLVFWSWNSSLTSKSWGEAHFLVAAS